MAYCGRCRVLLFSFFLFSFHTDLDSETGTQAHSSFLLIIFFTHKIYISPSALSNAFPLANGIMFPDENRCGCVFVYYARMKETFHWIGWNDKRRKQLIPFTISNRMQWKSALTAFSVIYYLPHGTGRMNSMYIGWVSSVAQTV